MATPALDHVLRHNAWANKTLLEFCAALEPAALDLSAAGTYGTLYGTLQHIVGGEQFYIRLLTDEVLGRPVRKTERFKAYARKSGLVDYWRARGWPDRRRRGPRDRRGRFLTMFRRLLIRERGKLCVA